MREFRLESGHKMEIMTFFHITIGLHQSSTLSPTLFWMYVWNTFKSEHKNLCFFPDNIVLLGESREELNGRFETWRQALETSGFHMSRNKMDYMECNFSKRRNVFILEVQMGDHIVSQVTRFKYMRSIVQNNGETGGDVNHKIQVR